MATERHLTAGAVDGVCVILFGSAYYMTALGTTQLDPVLALLVLALGPLIYVDSLVLDPLRKSKPIDQSTAGDLPFLPRMSYRITASSDSRVVDLIFWRFIILKQRHFENANVRQVIANHEAAHISNRDSVYFHLIGIMGASLFIAIIATTYANLPEAAALNPKLASFSYSDFFGNLKGVVLMWAAFLLIGNWLRLSLHAREFRADQAAFTAAPIQTTEWLRRLANTEADHRKSVLGRLHALKSALTHPTAETRFRNITVTSKKSLWQELGISLQLLLLMFTSGAMAGGIVLFTDSIIHAGNDGVATIVIGATLAIACSLCVGAVISIATWDFLDGSGALNTARFLAVFVGTMIGILIPFTAVQISYFPEVTADLPDVPVSGFWEGVRDTTLLLACAVSIGVCLNTISRRLSIKWSSKLMVHMIIGAVIIAGPFAVSRFLHTSLG